MCIRDRTVTITVPEPETPYTGDDRNYGVWIGLGAIALGAAVSANVLDVYKRQDELSDEEQREALIHLSVKWAEKEGAARA